LARAVAAVFGVPDHPVKIIGTRHGEKLYETLLTREEMVKAEDLGEYYRIPADNRTLNYDKYFVDGDASIDTGWEYTSHNTRRLGVSEVKELLLKLPYVKEQLADEVNR
jgi:UDP-glucose 4-epimerase